MSIRLMGMKAKLIGILFLVCSFNALGQQDTAIDLSKDTITLDEVIIRPNSGQKRKNLAGRVQRKFVDHYLPGFAPPYTVKFARFFEYASDYKATPYIETLRIMTQTDQQAAKFRVQLFQTDADGKPGRPLLRNDLAGTAAKGRKWTEVYLGPLGIPFPKEGLFVGIEWVFNEPNRTFVYNTFEPEIGFMVLDTQKGSWVFKNGTWTTIYPFQGEIPKFKNKFKHLAAEIVLTNSPGH